MKYIWTILLALAALYGAEADTCPKPSVHKNNMIVGGIKLWGSPKSVDSAKECYAKCCSFKMYNSYKCTTAVINYERRFIRGNGGRDQEQVTKMCELYDCRPSKQVDGSTCGKISHNSYAIIELPIEDNDVSPTVELPEATKEKKVETEMPITTTKRNKKIQTTTVPNLVREEAKTLCPNNNQVNCFIDPCSTEGCPAHPTAICKPNYCGGCNAHFYLNSVRVHCEIKKTTTALLNTEPAQKATMQVKQANEEAVIVGESDYGEKPDEKLPSASDEDTDDEYYQGEHRAWITEKVHLVTSPTKKPTVAQHPMNDPPLERVPVVPVKDDSGLTSVTAIPLLVALIVCIIALIVIVLKYRFHCSKRGKPRKFKIDDGDYLINGMYL